MEINKVGVVGAGQMGCGIAHVMSLAGYDVLLHDIDHQLLNKGVNRIKDNLERQVRSGRINSMEKSKPVQGYPQSQI